MTSVLTVTGSGDTARATRDWSVDGEPVGSILLVHGIGEHSGRYEHVGDWFAARGWNVHALDLPGCGESGGRRAFVTSFDEFVGAVAAELATLPTDRPKVMYGHSMGGLICLKHALSDHPSADRYVVSAPSLDAAVPGWQRASAPWLARLVPTLAIPNPIKGDQLSSDPAVGEAYFADPLVYTKATAALAAALFSTMAEVRAELPALDAPIYALHGGDDTLVPPGFSAALGEIPGVTRRLWPGLRHECHNEPQWEQVLGEVLDWLERPTV